MNKKIKSIPLLVLIFLILVLSLIYFIYTSTFLNDKTLCENADNLEFYKISKI